MYYFDQLGTEEIAARLGVQSSTVRNQLSRARARLRERLERRFGGDWKALCIAAFLRPSSVPVPPPPPPGISAGLAGPLAAALLLAVAYMVTGKLAPPPLEASALPTELTEQEVIDRNRRMSGGDASLNATVGSDEDSSMQWQDWLEDEDADQAGDYAEGDEMDTRRELLAEALEVLNDREKDILTQRRLSEETITLEDLSEQYGVSRERIRQIEVRAFEKLQKAMQRIASEKLMPVAA